MEIRNTLIYYRLIALWVLCEAMLGGLIHGLRIPVSGLVVGSGAVVCISLIAWYVPSKGAILKATIVVAIFKMMLSPHASFPAYFAVLFQGALGELLFHNRKNYRLACLALAILALLESGLQRILVLTIIYGNEFWMVVNDFINGLTRQLRPANYSLWIGGIYVAMHFVTGIAVGLFAGSLPEKIKRHSQDALFSTQPALRDSNKITREKKKKKFRLILLVFWLFLLFIYIQSEFSIGQALFPSSIPLKIFIRSVLIITGWFFYDNVACNSKLPHDLVHQIFPYDNK